MFYVISQIVGAVTTSNFYPYTVSKTLSEEGIQQFLGIDRPVIAGNINWKSLSTPRENC